MSKFDLGLRVTEECPSGSTHMIKGSFAAQSVTDLFCYNQNTGVGAFFATVKNSQFDEEIPVRLEPHRVGGNHTFGRQWTHIIDIPVFVTAFPLPQIDNLLLFYDAATGIAEVYETDGNGNLNLKKQYSGWRTSWTQIIGGQFGKANLIFFDAASRVGEFYSINTSGDIELIEGWS